MHICIPIFQNLKISVHLPWKRQYEKLLIINWISLIPWKIYWRLTQVIENVLFRRFIVFCQSCIWEEFFLECSLNTNLPEERSQRLQTEEQLSSLPEDSTDTFKRNNIDRYLARPSVSFGDGKYSILDSFCFAEFTAYYSLIYKPKETNEGEEYQPDLLPDSLMEGNHENLNYPKIIKLMNSNEKKCSVGKFVEFLGIIPLTNIDFQRNMPIIYFFFFFFHFDQKNNFLEDICLHTRGS